MTRIRLRYDSKGLNELNIRTTARWRACQHSYSGKVTWRVPASGGDEVAMPVCDGCGVPAGDGGWMRRWKIRDYAA